MRFIYYCEYLSIEHLRLLEMRYKEEHCIFIDGLVFIRLVSP